MTSSDLTALIRLHSDLRRSAHRHEEIAARCGEHVDREAADAVIAYHQADALEAVLERLGVYRPPVGQLALFSDGTRP